MHVQTLTSSILCVVAFLALALPGQAPALPTSPAPAANPATPVVGNPDLLGGFVANAGQWDHGARYQATIRGTGVLVEDHGFLLSAVTAEHADRLDGQAVRLRFVHSSGAVVRGERQLPGRLNFFLGDDPTRWRRDVARYECVRWQQPWPGVDVIGYQQDDHLEYDVALQPGADLARVEFAVEGGRGLSLGTDGALVIETEGATLRQTKPVSWSVAADGSLQPITVGYELRGADRFGFVATAWTGDHPLIVDPGLIWSTYVGGSENEQVHGLYIDASGLVTYAGFTRSPNFPTTPGTFSQTFQGGPNGAGDACVVRLDPSLSGSAQLVAATFVGSGDWDSFLAMHVDAALNVTCAGACWGQNFPTTPNRYSGFATPTGVPDVVVCQLDWSLSQLTYSTYVGGTGDDRGGQVHHDLATRRITVGVQTNSTDFPVTSNAPQPNAMGALGYQELALFQLNPTLSGSNQLEFSTYFGGSHDDWMYELHVSSGGEVTFCGATRSNDLPTTPNAYDQAHNGGHDAYVARIDLSQPSLPNRTWSYCTYFGGPVYEQARAMDVDGNGVVTLGGLTNGPGIPVASGTPFQPFQPSYSGAQNNDGFLARLDPSLPPSQQLVYSTFFGGPGFSSGVAGLVIDSGGIITFVGHADANIVTTPGAWDPTHNGGRDAFLARLDPSLPASMQLLYSTYFGGPGDESAGHVSTSGSLATLVGDARLDLPITPNAYQTANAGNTDVFVCQIDMQPLPPPVLTSISPSAVTSWRPAEVTLTGLYMQTTQSIDLGGQPVNNFTILSSTQVRFTPPNALPIGPVAVTAANGLAQSSNSLTLNITASPLELQSYPVWVFGLPLQYQMIGGDNDLSLLLIAPRPPGAPAPVPTTIPGVVNLAIGGGAPISVGLFLNGPNGIAQTSITYSPLLGSPFVVDAQAIIADPLNLTLPVPTTNVFTTTIH